MEADALQGRKPTESCALRRSPYSYILAEKGQRRDGCVRQLQRSAVAP